MTDYKTNINGEWISRVDNIEILNPETEEDLGALPTATNADAQRVLEDAQEDQRDWSRQTRVARGNVLREEIELIKDHSDIFVRLLSTDAGYPCAESQGEVSVSVRFFRNCLPMSNYFS